MRRFVWPMRWKILALILVVGLVPMGITAFVQFRTAHRLMRNSALALLESSAAKMAGDLDELHSTLQRTVIRLSRQPAVERSSADAAGRVAHAEDLKTVMQSFLASDDRLRSISLLSADGTVVASTESGVLGRNLGFRRYFREASQGTPGTPEMLVGVPEVGSMPLVVYSAPVTSHGRVVGVAVLAAQASAVWDLVRAPHAGDGGFAVVLDQHGIRLANSARRDLVFHPAFRLPPAEVEALTASLEFGERTQTLLQQVVEFEAGFLRARGAALPDDFTTPNAANGLNNLAHMRRLRNAPWTLFVMVPEPSLNAPVRSLVESTAAANAGVVLFALIVGGLVAGRIVRPIRSLSDAAERMRNGDLTARVPVTSRDEVGQLGDAFNAMAFTLASAQEQLEEKVRARTEALASAKVSLERQNADLALRAAELTERQTRDLSFARTLSALAGTGPMRDAIVLALSEADTYLDSLMLACYRLDKDKQSPARLVPMASRGSEAHPLPLSGRVAEAFAAHKPVVVTLPEGAELRFETGIARGRPQCVALVPLSMGERDVGLLMAGFPGRPLGQQIAFMVELALPLALTVARHELLEQTERFALQLAQRNEVLREQSNELAAKQTELTQKNVEIERANQLKSEFLANMSHELRTPLNAVIGFSELMLESPERMPQDHVQFVRDILASGRHLLSLINAVLDLAKIEAGRVSLELEPIDAREAMMTACALVSAMAQKKHLAVSQICRTSRSALADAGKLQQVLLNLLSNAIKFSQEGKRIEVGVEDQGEFLRFWVRDEGPGIPESLRRDLFKPFMQGESPLQKQHEGTGLGLAITRRLVEHHGGEVGVESEMGRGSTFWALMPAAERTAAAAEPALPIAPAPVPAERPRVLVVEDDPANARLLRFHLESDGYAVFEATREKEALETVRRVRPQLVLLDLILPEGEDGLNVLRELKSNEETAKTPVVVVSVVQETRKARELGAAECFVKPIDAQRLMETVQRLCPSTAKAKPRATVLVVDDHDLNRELAKTLLERRGCRVVLARDGEQGVQMARAERPDLVLLDLAMPVKDGLTAARELKADPQTKAIPLVAFTALAMRGDEERARKAGFDGYLSKPLEKSALDATLARFISLPLQQSGT